jgi:signal transduction histidine kinase/ligand-binding sensor domain-containing protein
MRLGSALRLQLLCPVLGCGLSLAGAAALPVGEWSLRTWRVEEGLIENTVTSVAQAPTGFLWVATLHGVARFDGVKFDRVNVPLATTDRAQPVRVLLFARDQRLWIAMDGGGLVVLGASRTNVFSAEMGLSVARPLCLTEDAGGAVWASYTDGSACQVNGGKVRHFTPADGLEGTGPTWLASDVVGNIWFAKAGRIGVWDGHRFTSRLTVPERQIQLASANSGGVWANAAGRVFHLADGGEVQPLATVPLRRPGGEMRAICADPRGDGVWIGTSTEGLFHCRAAGATRVETSHGEVLNISPDREGNLWVGTGGGGLNRIRPQVIALHGPATGLPFETVRSVCEDESGRVWAATLNGELAVRERDRWRSVAPPAVSGRFEATSVAPAGGDDLWVGTTQLGVLRWSAGGFTPLAPLAGSVPRAVRSLLMTRQGVLWAGMESPDRDHPNTVMRWQQGTAQLIELPLASRVVRAMAEDAEGQVWMGTPDGLLLRVAGESLTNETARVLGQPKPIRSLLATADGALWIGLAGPGLVRWKDGRAHRFGPEQGLPDGFVSTVLADRHDGLWVACTRGLFRVPRAEFQAVAEGRLPGLSVVAQERMEGLRALQGNYGHSPGALAGRDGRLWIPMRTGLAEVRPDQAASRTGPPAAVIERVLVDGVPLPADGGAPVRFRANHRSLVLEFTAPTFRKPEQLLFRHRLAGWDDGWGEATGGRRATFSRLPPGKYEFHVTAATEPGEWHEAGAVLAFAVTPLFWQTGWFRVGVAGVVALLGAALVRHLSQRRLRLRLQEVERESMLHRERARIAKDIHDDLGASLMHISLLGELVQQDAAQPEQAAHHARVLTHTARQLMKSLDETVWAVNPKNDTLAHLLDYTGQFAVSFLRAAGLSCTVEFPLNPPARVVPADVRHHLFLTVKEALHNVVKHSRATAVHLTATLTEAALELQVEDDGQGFAAASEDALADGLRNMRQRLAEVGGDCEIQSQPGRGTRVQIHFPWAAAGRRPASPPPPTT